MILMIFLNTQVYTVQGTDRPLLLLYTYQNYDFVVCFPNKNITRLEKKLVMVRFVCRKSGVM